MDQMWIETGYKGVKHRHGGMKQGYQALKRTEKVQVAPVGRTTAIRVTQNREAIRKERKLEYSSRAKQRIKRNRLLKTE